MARTGVTRVRKAQRAVMKSPLTRFLYAAALVLTACASPSVPDHTDAAETLLEVAATADGRTRHLVRLRPVASSALRLRVTDPRFGSHQAPEVIQAVQQLERAHRISAAVVLSRSTQAFAAMLTPAEVERLRRDPGVAAVDPEGVIAFSSDAHSVWLEQPVGTEVKSWGKQAVGGRDGNGGGLQVYVVDSGIEDHSDLNIARWVNAVSPNNPAHARLPSCHPHGTHVAGIIGAKKGGGGVRGVAPGVPLISVSVLDPATIGNGCLPNAAHPSNVAAALEWVRSDLVMRKHPVPAVVNLSLNGYSSPGQVVHGAIKHLSTPVDTDGYLGALVVQSAGNQYTSACSWAYTPTSGSDGVIVVGAINDHGQPVRALQGFHGFQNMPEASNEPGSNYGPCVEMWAPGAAIRSTWRGNDRRLMGGTSMAAPHVTGLAAAMASGPRSVQIEAQVVATLQALGTNDQTNRPVSIPSTAHMPPGTPRNRPYGELRALPPNAHEYQTFPSRRPGETLELYDDEGSVVWMGSTGAPGYTCLVDRQSPAGSIQRLGTAPEGRHDNLPWTPGTWRVFSSCLPAEVRVISRPAPRVTWRLDGVPQVDDATVELPADTTQALTFTSVNAVNCDIELAWHDNFSWPPHPGYPLLGVGTAGATPLQRTPTSYHYRVVCRDAVGTERSSDLNVQIAPVLAPSVDDATFVAQTVPSSVAAGATFTAAVTMRNTGNTTWSHASGYRLGSQNPHDNTNWGTGRLYLAAGDQVAPQETKTFTMTFTAPATPGTYAFQWRMVRETIAWFGATTPSVSVTVVPAGCVNPVCVEGSTRTRACGNCGSAVDTCSASCQWVTGSCGSEGVCSPGESADCCPDTCGACQCPGVKSCDATCQWNVCEGAACAPPCH